MTTSTSATTRWSVATGRAMTRVLAATLALGVAACAQPASQPPVAQAPAAPVPPPVYVPQGVDPALAALIAKHANANGVPVELVHKVVLRESRYQPNVIGRGQTMGLMQIMYTTARGLGYTGTPRGLLDPDTNLTWGVLYLAGAYRKANGDQALADRYYARGYAP